MRPTTLVGRSPLWTMQDDHCLVELVNKRGTGKWKAKLEDLRNNKHVCTRIMAKDQLRERLKLLSGGKKGSKGEAIKSPYASDFPTTVFEPSDAQIAAADACNSIEEREKYFADAERVHATEEAHSREMWLYIRETSARIMRRESLADTNDERGTPEEVELRRVAMEKEHRDAQQKRKQDGMELAQTELKYRKAITTGLQQHQAMACTELVYMASMSVYVKLKAINKFGTTEQSWDEQVQSLIQSQSNIEPEPEPTE